MKRALFIALLLLILTSSSVAQTQQQTTTAPKMIEFHMALLKRGPKWSPNPGKDLPSLQQQHVEYVQSMLKSGQAVIAGPIKDESELVGVYILRAKSADEARNWVNADPAVANGHVIAELHPWWSEDVMKKTETPQKLTTAFLAFLVRGAKWTPEKTPQTEEIQKGHMANIHRLADMKKLVVAGPFGDDGVLRGIFVFRVDSLEEARALTLTDPAVQAGRLALDLHPWLVPEGILP
ncbi:MAG TPA: YciI family protein [Pyrinomonadaceae bacterium]|jgi:uncharacterized protein YciI|nr:YciI family protein [Pyrinomonadaceae bacterium]